MRIHVLMPVSGWLAAMPVRTALIDAMSRADYTVDIDTFDWPKNRIGVFRDRILNELRTSGHSVSFVGTSVQGSLKSGLYGPYNAVSADEELQLTKKFRSAFNTHARAFVADMADYLVEHKAEEQAEIAERAAKQDRIEDSKPMIYLASNLIDWRHSSIVKSALEDAMVSADYNVDIEIYQCPGQALLQLKYGVSERLNSHGYRVIWSGNVDGYTSGLFKLAGDDVSKDVTHDVTMHIDPCLISFIYKIEQDMRKRKEREREKGYKSTVVSLNSNVSAWIKSDVCESVLSAATKLADYEASIDAYEWSSLTLRDFVDKVADACREVGYTVKRSNLGSDPSTIFKIECDESVLSEKPKIIDLISVSTIGLLNAVVDDLKRLKNANTNALDFYLPASIGEWRSNEFTMRPLILAEQLVGYRARSSTDIPDEVYLSIRQEFVSELQRRGHRVELSPCMEFPSPRCPVTSTVLPPHGGETTRHEMEFQAVYKELLEKMIVCFVTVLADLRDKAKQAVPGPNLEKRDTPQATEGKTFAITRSQEAWWNFLREEVMEVEQELGLKFPEDRSNLQYEIRHIIDDLVCQFLKAKGHKVVFYGWPPYNHVTMDYVAYVPNTLRVDPYQEILQEAKKTAGPAINYVLNKALSDMHHPKSNLDKP